MKNTTKFIITLGLLAFISPVTTLAHSGRTDSAGCHTCRTNCSSWGLSTGEYHCHNAKSVAQPIEPIKSTYGANGTGYTTPAPEYKQPVTTVNKTTVTPSKVVATTTTYKKPQNTTKIPPVTSPIKVEEKKTSWFGWLFNWFK